MKGLEVNEDCIKLKMQNGIGTHIVWSIQFDKKFMPEESMWKRVWESLKLNAKYGKPKHAAEVLKSCIDFKNDKFKRPIKIALETQDGIKHSVEISKPEELRNIQIDKNKWLLKIDEN